MILRDMSDRASTYYETLHLFTHFNNKASSIKNFKPPSRLARRQLICSLGLECGMVKYSLSAFAKMDAARCPNPKL